MIRHIADALSTEVNTEEDFEHLAISITSTLTKDAQCFERSTNLYNSDFFKGEPLEMRLSLCTALSDFFHPFMNSFWTSNRRPEV